MALPSALTKPSARSVVGVVLAAALASGITLLACSGGETPKPPLSPRASDSVTPPIAASGSADPAAAPTGPANALDAGATDPAASRRQRAIAAAACQAPQSEVSKPPADATVFNNAMTSVDAGFIDRTQGVLDVITSQSKALACCFDHAAAGEQLGVMLELTLAADGTPEAAINAKLSAPLERLVHDCIVVVLQQASYPASPSGKETRVEYLLRATPRPAVSGDG